MTNTTTNSESESQQLVEVNESRVKELAAFEVARDAKAIVTSWAKWIVGTVTLCFALLGFKTYRDIHIAIQTKTSDQIDKADVRIQEALEEFETESKNAILRLENEVKEVKRRADGAKQYLALLVKPKPKSVRPPDVLEGEPLIVGPGTSIAISSEAGSSIATICCVVQDASGSRFVISANYVPDLLDKEAVDVTSNQKIGAGVRYTPTASLIKLDKGVAAKIGPPNRPPFAGIGIVDSGDDVFAYGFKSGMLKGTVHGRMARARIVDNEHYVETFISASLVVANGDGGGPVVNSKNQLVGMVYSHSDETSQIIPIEDILRGLNVTLVVAE